jgi:hypothetical protein
MRQTDEELEHEHGPKPDPIDPDWEEWFDLGAGD